MPSLFSGRLPRSDSPFKLLNNCSQEVTFIKHLHLAANTSVLKYLRIIFCYWYFYLIKGTLNYFFHPSSPSSFFFGIFRLYYNPQKNQPKNNRATKNSLTGELTNMSLGATARNKCFCPAATVACTS